MILGQISYLDCLAFVIFLAPQLLLRQPFRTLIVVTRALPFFCMFDRLFLSQHSQSQAKAVVVPLHSPAISTDEAAAALVLPYTVIRDRIFTSHPNRPPFVQQATWFQDIVIRVVRYAFANIPASIGAVFFSKSVALPFFYARMWRHRIARCPIHWEEVQTVSITATAAFASA